MANSRRIQRAVAAIIFLLPMLYFHEAARGTLVLLQGDGWTSNLGLRLLTAKLLAQGSSLLWNPYIFGGMPLLADLSAGVLYPLNWIYVVLPPGVAANLTVIATFHLALLGAYLYARSIGGGRAAALVTGISFAFGGYMVMSLGQSQNIAAAAWLPWILLALEKLYQQLSWRWLVLGAVAVTLQFFAGMPQLTLYAVLLAWSYFLFCVCARPVTVPRWRYISVVVLLAACAVLLSAVQWLPARELQLASGRAALSYESFAEFSFPPKQIGALVLPFLFGGATMPPYHVPYTGEAGIFVTCGYMGLLALFLVCAAGIGRSKEKLVWFWAAIAALALLFSFGGHLPFQLNHLLFKLPIYQLFRAAYRHMCEFTFAIAVLAGLGLDALLRLDAQKRRALYLQSCMAMMGLFTVAALSTRQLTITAPELLIPGLCLVACSSVLGWLARQPSQLSKGVLLAVLVVDLLAYGHALEWRTNPYRMLNALADPPAVQFLKQREPDLQAFRILSDAPSPFGASYSALNFPNTSIARELQSVNGYDMLRLTRSAEVLGAITPEGSVVDAEAFGTQHQGFNLFNVKYLIGERTPAAPSLPLATADDVIYDGSRFPAQPLDTHLRRGVSRELRVPGNVLADELVLVTTLSNSGTLPDNTPVAAINIRTRSGSPVRLELQAGRDTAEWAIDRADVRARHRRATVIESWPEEGFTGHRYLARLRFPRTLVKAVELSYAADVGDLVVYRAALHDTLSGAFYAPQLERWPAARWRKLAEFGTVAVYENLSCLPRAWVVEEVRPLSQAEVLQTIRRGELPNGESFRPDKIALVETTDSQQGKSVQQSVVNTPATVQKITSGLEEGEYLVTNAQSAMLVLSEVYYPGWEAELDNKPAPLWRVDYALRGVSLPTGEHRVRLRFRPVSVRCGVILMLLGAVLLLACYPVVSYVQKRKG